jgi:hypothetical protein
MIHTLASACYWRWVLPQAAAQPPPATTERMFETTFESAKRHADPFNEVDVEVIFVKDGQTWRVPTFWRGAIGGRCAFHRPLRGCTLIDRRASMAAILM